MSNVAVAIVGAGSHAFVLLDCIGRHREMKVVGFVDASLRAGSELHGIRVLGNDEQFVAGHSPTSCHLVNGIGGVGRADRRRVVFEMYSGLGFRFLPVIHASATVSETAKLSHGIQVMAGAIIQSGTQIGVNSLVNTGAIVEHDSVVGDHVHIASGALLCGSVRVADNVHIGAGATIIQGIKIGAGSLVGAGSVVIRDVEAGSVVMGVPARRTKTLGVDA